MPKKDTSKASGLSLRKPIQPGRGRSLNELRRAQQHLPGLRPQRRSKQSVMGHINQPNKSKGH